MRTAIRGETPDTTARKPQAKAAATQSFGAESFGAEAVGRSAGTTLRSGTSGWRARCEWRTRISHAAPALPLESVNAPTFAPLKGDPWALFALVNNPGRIRVLAPGVAFTLTRLTKSLRRRTGGRHGAGKSSASARRGGSVRLACRLTPRCDAPVGRAPRPRCPSSRVASSASSVSP